MDARPVSAAEVARVFDAPASLVSPPEPGDIFAAYARGRDAADPVVMVRVTCPCCGADGRTFDTTTRLFGCLLCTYTSDERNA
ncbi:MAG: hypothetical protein IJO71_08890 [Microbacterium sp.]|uniref:hypothetical protein n=1 Tax=Microbacterium sp. TaxID=51671 RepID=UPI0025EB89FA|nr:hypothetical protein [Microbacterium sp.]MBQ9917300.1 hypothetical protein [Microbacterium sp.]